MIPQGKPRTRITSEEMNEICDVLMSELFAMPDVIGARFNVDVDLVRIAAKYCHKRDGLTREERRGRAIKAFWAENPDATFEDAVAELGVKNVEAARYYKTKYCRGLPVQSSKAKEERERRGKIATAMEHVMEEAVFHPKLSGDALLEYVSHRYGVEPEALKARLLTWSCVSNATRARYFEPMTMEEERRMLEVIDRFAKTCVGRDRQYCRTTIPFPDTTRVRELKVLMTLKYEAHDFCHFCGERVNEYVFYAERAIRPEWYVADVVGRGYPGISLPEEHFNRYLELYKRKRARIGEYVAEEEDD